MRLKSVYISRYKNLRDFDLKIDGNSFIDVFVGKNGSGKSNLFEALIEIFRHLDQLGLPDNDITFDYRLSYEIEGQETEIEWKNGKLRINQDEDRKTLGKTPFPDNLLIYYSGHNKTVAGLVQLYEETFRKRIKRADQNESRFILGIGPEYKELLLAVLLMQPDSCTAKRFISQKLGIETIDSEVRMLLTRPAYATDSRFDIEDFETDRYWKPEGITKTFLDRLHGCISATAATPVRSEGYFAAQDQYILYFGIDTILQEFTDLSPQELFRQFDNLKTLGMLSEILIPLKLNGGVDANISYFSDGQFQSVYIYSIVELFKDRNCITLLDEPDSFLHPEWQFDFLNQVFEITDTTAKNNHVLMSSHSASTISSANENFINLFEFDGEKVSLTKVNKADVIKSLSSGLIIFSESEARLNIQHVVENTTGPVLFTEGITDDMILATAWKKLFPTEKRPFEIQNAFDCAFLRNLLCRDELYQNHPGRTFFGLFDFDEAFEHWKQLGDDVQTNPDLCLTKQRRGRESYALLLPVPATGQIRNQVINPRTQGNFKNKSLLTIELLFHGVPGLDKYFTIDTDRPDGFIKFRSDKTKFAQNVVPTLNASHFGVFRPLFDFIKSKC